MSQLELHLLGRMDGPSAVPADEIAKIRTYRDACTWCWMNRRIKSMTASSLAERTGMRPSHISDYFAADPIDNKGRKRRNMPGEYVPALELVAGNTAISQWMAAQTWTAETIQILVQERKSA